MERNRSYNIRIDKLAKLALKALLLLCVFTFMYSIKPKMMPSSFTMLLGACGVGIGILKWICFPITSIKISASLKYILQAMLAVVCVSVLSLAYNSTTDLYFPKLMLTNGIAFSGAYMLSLFIKKIYHEVRFDTVVKYITLSACLQMVLTLWLFFTPNSVEILGKILASNELALSVMERTEGTRLLGFGVSFFDSGIIHSVVLFLIALVMNRCKLSFWGTFGYTFAFILIGAVGMMTARTTIVGLSVSLAYGIYNARFWHLLLSKKLRDMFKTVFIIASVVTVVILSLPSDIRNGLEVISNFGFEMFIKLSDSGKLETGSTDVMYEMYIYPDNWKTWLVGDGAFAEPLDPEFLFYKGTDIGFIRMLFYFGIIGLLVFYLYELTVIYQIYKKNTAIGLLPFAILYVMFFLLNLKGMTDLFALLIPFYFCTYQDKGLSVK